MVGAASAQVTVSGDISYGWAGKKQDDNSVVTQGFGGRTGNIVFGVKEDLGGGLSIDASASIDTALRNDTVTGNGASMTLAGGFGSVKLSSGEESANGIVGNAGGVNFADMAIGFQTTRGATDTESASTSDSITYALPAMNGISLSILIGDSGGGLKSGYGDGSSSGDNGVTQYIGSYAAGPLSLKVDMTDYAETGKSNRTRINASYDLGVAKISIGNSRGGVTSNKNDQTAWGVTMPMGAVTLGVGGVTATTTAKVSATGLTATYALSKTTSVVFSTASASGTIPAAGMKKLTEVYLKKAF